MMTLGTELKIKIYFSSFSWKAGDCVPHERVRKSKMVLGLPRISFYYLKNLLIWNVLPSAASYLFCDLRKVT